MPHDRELREKEIHDKYAWVVFGGEYHAGHGLLMAIDLLITGGETTVQFLQDEMTKWGINLVHSMATADPPINPATEPLYVGKFIFRTWESPFGRRWYGPNKFVPYVAARKRSEADPRPAIADTKAIYNVERIDYNCTAAILCGGDDYIYWVDRGTTQLRQARIHNGQLDDAHIVDNNCTAVAIAATQGFLYWIDAGSTVLRRGQIINGQIRNVERVDNNCQARLLAADQDIVYWIDAGTRILRRGLVTGGSLGSVQYVDDNCSATALAVGSGYLFWRDEGQTILRMAVVNSDGALGAVRKIDDDCVARLLACDGERLLWLDDNSTVLRCGMVITPRG